MTGWLTCFMFYRIIISAQVQLDKIQTKILNQKIILVFGRFSKTHTDYKNIFFQNELIHPILLKSLLM